MKKLRIGYQRGNVTKYLGQSLRQQKCKIFIKIKIFKKITFFNFQTFIEKLTQKMMFSPKIPNSKSNVKLKM